ncbi:hypothetical protein AA21952_1405 [Acetobacter oeni LMG 21952]|nr:hypothetical protein AA21952_1405 [Acetobacter oeni LMG 21952]
MLTLVFMMMAAATRFLCTDSVGYSAIWPPNAILLVALLTLRARLATGVLAVCFLFNLFINRFSALSPSEAVLACAFNLFQATVAAFFTRRFCGGITDLARLRRFLTFTVIALLVSALEAGIGTAIESIWLGIPVRAFAEWLQWVLCDTLGLLIATPVVLTLVRGWKKGLPNSGVLAEPLTVGASSIALTVFAFSSPQWAFLLCMYPALVFLAFHAHGASMSIAMFCVSLCAAALTAHGIGPVAGLEPGHPLIREMMLQSYLFSLVLTVLMVNSTIGENRRYTRRLSLMKRNLEYLATHDSLTSLINRSCFQSRLALALERRSCGALFLIDVDYFKQINDNLGHHVGDEFLKEFSRRMLDFLQAHDTAPARFGGDEFAVIIPGKFSPRTIDYLCGAFIRDLLLQPYRLAETEYRVTASIGVTLFGPEDALRGTGEIMRQADIALYAAKRAGRNGYRLFSHGGMSDILPHAGLIRQANVAAAPVVDA